ncbi:hypothetical protein EVAR_48409_1 [Eumeta japonica]|uniref:Uncharacterized protein n=1 Tax=Eumeta variegata TaxID=151549 RepID=A0A4C1XQD7_EUMVA|nr:hypothetical protein EVAR_48409_1 [Eumeta japonica]
MARGAISMLIRTQHSLISRSRRARQLSYKIALLCMLSLRPAPTRLALRAALYTGAIGKREEDAGVARTRPYSNEIASKRGISLVLSDNFTVEVSKGMKGISKCPAGKQLWAARPATARAPDINRH